MAMAMWFVQSGAFARACASLWNAVGPNKASSLQAAAAALRAPLARPSAPATALHKQLA